MEGARSVTFGSSQPVRGRVRCRVRLNQMNADNLPQLSRPLRSEMSQRVTGCNHAREQELKKKVGWWFTEQNIVLNKIKRGQNAVYKTMLRVNMDKKKFARDAHKRRQDDARRKSHEEPRIDILRLETPLSQPEVMVNEKVTETENAATDDTPRNDKRMETMSPERGKDRESKLSVSIDVNDNCVLLNKNEAENKFNGGMRDLSPGISVIDVNEPGRKNAIKDPHTEIKYSKNSTPGPQGQGGGDNTRPEGPIEVCNESGREDKVGRSRPDVDGSSHNSRGATGLVAPVSVSPSADVDRTKNIVISANSRDKINYVPHSTISVVHDDTQDRPLLNKRIRSSKGSALVKRIEEQVIYEEYEDVPATRKQSDSTRNVTFPPLRAPVMKPLTNAAQPYQLQTELSSFTSEEDISIDRVKNTNHSSTVVEPTEGDSQEKESPKKRTKTSSSFHLISPILNSSLSNKSQTSMVDQVRRYRKMKENKQREELQKLPVIIYKKTNDGAVVPVPEVNFKRSDFIVPDKKDERMRKKLLEQEKEEARTHRERVHDFYEVIEREVGIQHRRRVNTAKSDAGVQDVLPEPVTQEEISVGLASLVNAFLQDRPDPSLDPNSVEAISKCRYIRTYSSLDEKNKVKARRNRKSSWSVPPGLS